jgi:predicted GNAT family acetyltransferase
MQGPDAFQQGAGPFSVEWPGPTEHPDGDAPCESCPGPLRPPICCPNGGDDGERPLTETPTPQGTVVERPLAGRFELDFPGGQAFALYRSDGDRIIVSHTEVPSAFNGRGIGSRLAEGIFQLARTSGRRVVPRCSFVADWARRHPEYADVLG